MAPERPRASFGRRIRNDSPAERPDTFAEERERHERDDDPVGRDIVAADDAHRQQHAADDRRLARKRQRMAAPDQRVGQIAAEYAAGESADRGQRCHQTRVQDRHAARLHEVDRKPRQEEVGQHVDAVLGEIDAEQHAVGQQLAHEKPAAGCSRCRWAALACARSPRRRPVRCSRVRRARRAGGRRGSSSPSAR